jgi:hypothetical protein
MEKSVMNILRRDLFFENKKCVSSFFNEDLTKDSWML